MSFFSLIPGIVTVGADIVEGVGGVVGGGGGKDAQGRTICPGTPSDAQVTAVLTSATDSQLRVIEQHWNTSRGRELGVPLRNAPPREVSYWLMGNRDCKHSDPQGAVVQGIFGGLVDMYAPGSQVAPPRQTSTVDNVVATIKEEVRDTASAAAQGVAIQRQSGLDPMMLLVVLGAAGLILFARR